MVWWPTIRAAFYRTPAKSTVNVTVREQREYGVASVSIAGRSATSVDAAGQFLSRFIFEARAGGTLPSLTLHVSGGVRQQELESLRRAILQAAGGCQVTIALQSYGATDRLLPGADSPHGAQQYVEGK